MVFDPDEAQDLAQDVFLKVYANRATYTAEGKFSTWLYRIATNAAIDRLRRRRKRRSISLSSMAAVDPDEAEEPELHETLAHPGSQTPHDILSAQEDWARLGSALEYLSDAHREVFEMRTVEGLDYETIGKRLGCTPGAARNRMHAAKQELKRNIGDMNP